MLKFSLIGVLLLLIIQFTMASILPGFIHLGILLLLLVLSIVIASIIGGVKAFGITILVFVVSIAGFNLSYYFSCSPNRADVKVMQPMAEKISNHIVKNGIPKSLKDIPDLPYSLEGCERNVKYSRFDKKSFNYIEIKAKNKATSESIKEECYFIKNKREYYLHSRILFEFNTNTKGITIDIGNKASKTWDIISFHYDENKRVIVADKINFGSSNTNGICNPMKQ